MWIDAHAHLADLSDELLSAILSDAHKAGVDSIVNCGTDIESSRQAIHQSSDNPILFPTAGISPFDANDLPPDWQKQLEALLSDTSVIALGEIGIDASNPTYPLLDKQLPLFESQLDLAVSHSLPAVIHSRGMEKRAAEICQAHKVDKAVFHCFTGDLESLKFILDSGYFVSFSGIITFKNQPLRDAVDYCPLDRLLIETDSPYLAPVPHRGKRNQPAWVGLAGEKAAEIKKVSVETISAAIRNNFRSLFRIVDANHSFSDIQSESV